MHARCLTLLIWSFVLVAFAAFSPPALGGAATVRDGNTLQLGETVYRLDGIDAPEFDQVCIDDHADPWTCGIEAREQLEKLVFARDVRCDDLGPDPSYKKRHIGICTVAGETSSLNRQLVREGFAISSRSPVKADSKDDEAKAREEGRGLWKGCFASPADFRIGKKDGTLLGRACQADRDAAIRAVLFPQDLTMPPACTIKGKLAARARFTGDIGIYHLQGCRSYAGLTRPDRWFCSEEDAQAAGFRKAYNCRTSRAK